MARLVRHDQITPVKIDPAQVPPGKFIWVCACGLSATYPICDKTHKQCSSEQPGLLYHYDPVTKAVLRTEQDPGPAAVPPATQA